MPRLPPGPPLDLCVSLFRFRHRPWMHRQQVSTSSQLSSTSSQLCISTAPRPYDDASAMTLDGPWGS